MLLSFKYFEVSHKLYTWTFRFTETMTHHDISNHISRHKVLRYIKVVHIFIKLWNMVVCIANSNLDADLTDDLLSIIDNIKM